ncbi:hypothetical protein BpHYR1_032876 [Brachionus plicatilis]|uniref:Uncharacterized protein n=1 Tax=Brachionus plicatilis TaxID=10195 RepID=A0A3M7P6Y0_BRAPC|nr:hypothetical protein BpHYR1_032876 [Brachionus plicatilis]
MEFRVRKIMELTHADQFEIFCIFVTLNTFFSRQLINVFNPNTDGSFLELIHDVQKVNSFPDKLDILLNKMVFIHPLLKQMNYFSLVVPILIKNLSRLINESLQKPAEIRYPACLFSNFIFLHFFTISNYFLQELSKNYNYLADFESTVPKDIDILCVRKCKLT